VALVIGTEAQGNIVSTDTSLVYHVQVDSPTDELTIAIQNLATADVSVCYTWGFGNIQSSRTDAICVPFSTNLTVSNSLPGVGTTYLMFYSDDTTGDMPFAVTATTSGTRHLKQQ
jgi:hypothetical protein